VALRDSVSVDTSMGLSPAGGLPMSTRSGDLDPGLLLFLMRQGDKRTHVCADALERLVNRDGGLAALANGKHDLRAIEQAINVGDRDAALALDSGWRQHPWVAASRRSAGEDFQPSSRRSHTAVSISRADARLPG
jgi:acetate kinase